MTPPDMSAPPPDAGSVPPDAGTTPPEAGAIPSDMGTTPPTVGTVPSDTDNGSDSDNATPQNEVMLFDQQAEMALFPGMVEQQPRILAEDSDVPELLPQEEGALPTLSIIPVLTLGSVTVRLGANYTGVYDTNILLASQSPQRDFAHTLSPRLSVGLGDYLKAKHNYLAFEYQPQFTFFQRYSQYNAIDQQLQLDGQYELTKTVMRGTLAYTHSSDPDRELQGRVSRDVLSSEVGATYQQSDRFSYDLDGEALIRTFQQGINSDEGRLKFWTRYAADSIWTVSVGPAVGALLPEEGDTQLFAQPWAAVQGKIGTDVNVDLRMGGDFREAQNSGEVMSTPVFDASVRYQPTTNTTLELSGVRQIFSSPDVVDQDYISTKVTLKASQIFWQTYTVAVEGGFENASYFQFGNDTAGVRSDNYPYTKVEFSYSRFKDLEVSAYYIFRENFSNAVDSSFSDQQVGVQLRVGY